MDANLAQPPAHASQLIPCEMCLLCHSSDHGVQTDNAFGLLIEYMISFLICVTK